MGLHFRGGANEIIKVAMGTQAVCVAVTYAAFFARYLKTYCICQAGIGSKFCLLSRWTDQCPSPRQLFDLQVQLAFFMNVVKFQPLSAKSRLRPVGRISLLMFTNHSTLFPLPAEIN
jgi:hypothetical protein